MSISLSMICRNEEVNIDRCLSSVDGVVDEVILVDTGSTDKTKEIALRHSNVKIVDFPWIDDFSAARNEGLKHVTSDWILFLDSDEIIAPECKEALKKLVKNSSKDTVYNVSIENLLEGDNKVIHCNFRLWPKHPEAIFLNPVHESLMIPKGFKQAPAPGIKIIHYGYMEEQKVRKDTNKRNLRILLKAVEKYPERGFMNYYIAQQYFIEQNYPLSLQYYEKTLDFLTKNQCVETKIFTPLVLVGILKCHLLLKHWDKVNEMSTIDTNTPDFYVELGGYFYGNKKYFDAIKTYEKAIEMRYRKDLCSVYDSGSLTWKAYSGLGNVYQALQNTIKAEDSYKLALAYAPDNPEILQVLYQINISVQNFGEAEKYLGSLIKVAPKPQYYVELGNIYLNTGKVDEAVDILTKYCKTEQLLTLRNILASKGYKDQLDILSNYMQGKGMLKVAPYRTHKDGPQFTVIIPTLLKAPKEVFQYTLNELSINNLVDKIIIIDNSEKKEFRSSFNVTSKMLIIDSEANMPPNNCFNYAMKLCNTKYYLLLNDDVLCHQSVISDCYNVFENDAGVGLLEILTYNFSLAQYLENIKQYDSNIAMPATYFERDTPEMTGWFICGRKEHWIDIPQELHMFYGDNYIYTKIINRGLKIMKICSKLISHFTSTTVKALGLYQQGVLEKEGEIFKKIMESK